MKNLLVLLFAAITLCSCLDEKYDIKCGTLITMSGDTLDVYGGTIINHIDSDYPTLSRFNIIERSKPKK